MSWRLVRYSEEDCARRFRQNWPVEATTSPWTHIVMAICLDNLLLEHRHSYCFSPSLSEHFGSEPEPMEVGVTRLPAPERCRRRQLRLCLYCGQGGHQLQRCPVRSNSGSTRAERRSRDLPPPGAGVGIPYSSLSAKPFLMSIELVDCPSCTVSTA